MADGTPTLDHATRATLKVRSPLKVSTQPLLTSMVLVLSDIFALGLIMTLAVYSRLVFGGELDPVNFLGAFYATIPLFLCIYAALGLYAIEAANPADEIRRITLGSLLVYMALGSITYIGGVGDAFSRGVYVIALLLTVFAVPIYRVAARRRFGRRSWWGHPTVVFGGGDLAEQVVKTLAQQPGLGLRPVAVMCDERVGETIHDRPVLHSALAPAIAADLKVPHAIIAIPGTDREKLFDIVEKQADRFPHLMIVPDLYGVGSLWVEAKDVGGVLGLELRRNLLMPWPRFVKRSIDLFGAVVGGLCILPLIALFALLIRLDSRGPVFYGQKRLGSNGKHFKAWKFRSMVSNADEVLETYLKEHPELQEEWEETQKLRNDPRVTRMGALLRKTSLDELPQLWNVLWGEMSMVGPRPIVDNEIEKYGKDFDLYKKVRPGMSGLWQVSGRSDTSYGERVGLDTYYVRNWSVWLDAYILVRTIGVVLGQKGAY